MGQRSVFSWRSLPRARSISINSRIDLCALSPYVYPIDIRIPLSAVSQTRSGECRSSFTEKYPVEILSFIIMCFLSIRQENLPDSIYTSRASPNFEFDKFDTVVAAIYSREFHVTVLCPSRAVQRIHRSCCNSANSSRSCPSRHFMIIDTVFTIHRIRNIVQTDTHFKSVVNNL